LPEDVLFDSEAEFLKTALWAQVILRPGPVTATLGLRADGVSALDQSWALGPRASLRYATDIGLDLKLAGGLFHQAPSKLALSVEEDGRPANNGLSQLRNWQLVGGADWKVTPGLRVRAEGFYKDYDRMPVLASDPRINLANLGYD
jgi:hypothetical protein